jgi:hypothetical protein
VKKSRRRIKKEVEPRKEIFEKVIEVAIKDFPIAFLIPALD